MKLRTKSIIVICLGFIVLSLVLSLTLHYLIIHDYSNLETKTVTENVGRVLNQLNQENSNLEKTSYDWSTWDDTYSFVEDKNETYIQNNLIYGIFYDIKINFMFFYNDSNVLVYSKAYDFPMEYEINLPSSLFSYISQNKEYLFTYQNLESNHTGIMVYDPEEAPLLISVTPILHSNTEGPIHGSLIIGQFFDEEKINSLENITHLSIAFHPLSSQSHLDFEHASFSVYGRPTFIQPKNSSYIAGYVLVNDVFGNPVYVVEVGSNRDIYNQGLLVIQNLVISLISVVVVLVAIVAIILDRFVTSRLMSLTKSVNDIKNYHDLSKRLPLKGNDEITILEKNINNMLTSLQKTWAMKDSAEFSLQKKINELERFKKITVDREIKMIELKKALQELQRKPGGKM